MRPWALLLLAVLLPPSAAAQETHAIQPDSYKAFPLRAIAGDHYEVEVVSDVPVDVLIVAGNVEQFYGSGNNGSARLVLIGLNATRHAGNGTFAADGPWTLVVDNTNRTLANGANGTQLAMARVGVAVGRLIVDPAPTPQAREGSRNPWPVLMLTSPHWDLGAVGLGGMALWLVVLAIVAAAGYREGWDKVAVLGVGGGLLVAVWWMLPHPGAMTRLGFPLLLAFALAWLAARGAGDGRQALRLAFLGAAIAAVAGVTAGHLLESLWSDPGMLVLGDGRFDDPLFVLPVAAAFAALLFTLVPAFVAAFEGDEEAPAAAQGPGLGATFTVTCLRCGTPIKVDRSMRRYRVATDRYEFACPNCSAWMEWAEPKGTTAP